MKGREIDSLILRKLVEESERTGDIEVTAADGSKVEIGDVAFDDINDDNQPREIVKQAPENEEPSVSVELDDGTPLELDNGDEETIIDFNNLIDSTNT